MPEVNYYGSSNYVAKSRENAKNSNRMVISRDIGSPAAISVLFVNISVSLRSPSGIYFASPTTFLYSSFTVYIRYMIEGRFGKKE